MYSTIGSFCTAIYGSHMLCCYYKRKEGNVHTANMATTTYWLIDYEPVGQSDI